MWGFLCIFVQQIKQLWLRKQKIYKNQKNSKK